MRLIAAFRANPAAMVHGLLENPQSVRPSGTRPFTCRVFPQAGMTLSPSFDFSRIPCAAALAVNPGASGQSDSGRTRARASPQIRWLNFRGIVIFCNTKYLYHLAFVRPRTFSIGTIEENLTCEAKFWHF
jgi:hypothetical protein